jgi:hypothetical protein
MLLKESRLQRASREFYRDEAKIKHEDHVFLSAVRIFAFVWVDACDNLQAYPLSQIERLETQIVADIVAEWGMSEVIFDRNKKTIVVKAMDGRSMELISGFPLEAAENATNTYVEQPIVLNKWVAKAKPDTSFEDGLQAILNDFFNEYDMEQIKKQCIEDDLEQAIDNSKRKV